MQRYKDRESESEREISDNVIGGLIEGVIVPWKDFKEHSSGLYTCD